MKRLWTAIGLLVLLIGCSEKETDKEPKFTVKDAIKKNHVVIQNLSDNEKELFLGATKAEHLTPMFSFLEDVEANKESTLEITIFPKTGGPVTSKVHFISEEKTVFTNNYAGYGMPKGEIECLNVWGSNQNFMLNGCKGEPSTVFVIPYSNREYLLAKNEYKKMNKK